MLHQWVIFLWLWAFHTALSAAFPSLSAAFCFLCLSLSRTPSHFSHFRRQRPADSLMAASGAKMKKTSKNSIKKNGIWKTHSVITWFTRHLRCHLSLLLLIFCFSFYFIFRFRNLPMKLFVNALRIKDLIMI